MERSALACKNDAKVTPASFESHVIIQKPIFVACA